MYGPCQGVEDIFSKLNGAKYFQTLNLCTWYHHIPFNEDYIPGTALTSTFGKYEYLKVAFGLAQGPAYFQELMNNILKDLPFAIFYLDDVIIYSETAEEHLDHLKQNFHKLCDVELTMELSKCHFFAKEIQHFSHIHSTTCIQPLPSITAAIEPMKPPKF